MDTFYNRFKGIIKGSITGFDRIVFKGMIRPLMYAGGMQSFLLSQGILNKDFKEFATATSAAIVQTAEEMSKTRCNCPTTYIRSSNRRKETLAHDRQRETGVNEGLIGIWSCVESCNSFRSTFNPVDTTPVLTAIQSRCKHLYFYFDDPVYGFMSIRLQTWAPYEIQIALNGRQWLRRSLDAVGCRYILDENKFLHIDDYDLAQKFLDEQRSADFKEILNRFTASAFPLMPEILGKHLSYYFTVWQSEVAKDYLFESPEALSPLMDDFLLHAMVSGTGERVLKYFGSPIKADGQPHALSNPEIFSRTHLWYDGVRVRHWNGKNSVKFYNAHTVLRFEMTMHDPAKYKIYRHAEGQDKSEPKQLRNMRKGIADISLRTAISADIVNRFTEHMSATKENARLEELLGSISTPLAHKRKRIRSLDAFGKDMELLRTISDPAFDIVGITNKDLQKKLTGTPWAKGMSGSALSGRISRHLFLLRKHGLIKKQPGQRRYSLTKKGRNITTAVSVALGSQIDELLKIAA